MADQFLTVRLRGDGSGLVGELRISEQQIGELKDSLDGAGRSADGASREVDGFGRHSRRAGEDANRLGREGEGVTRMFRTLKGVLATLGVGLVVRDIVRAGTEMQGLRAAMTAATGDSQRAGAEFAFVREEAERLGLQVQSTAREYTRLVAASKGTRLEGQATRDIFVAISEAGRVMNLTAEQQAGALNAVQQMMSKGSVQAEELRGQLGERIPGAFGLAARAMGKTTEELNDLLDRGEVLAEDLLPALARELRSFVAEGVDEAAGSAAAEFARLDNALLELQITLAESGFLGLFAELANVLSETVIPAVGRALEQIGVVTRRVERLTLGEIMLEIEANAERLLEVDRALMNANERETVLVQSLEQEYTKLIRRQVSLKERRDDLLAQLREVVTGTKAEANATEGSAGATGKADQAATKYLATLKEQLATIGLTKDQVIVWKAEQAAAAAESEEVAAQIRGTAAALAAEVRAREEATELAREHAAALRAEQRERERVTRELERQRQRDADLVDQLREELRLMGLTDREREIEIELRKLSAKATDEQRQEVRELVDALHDARVAQQEHVEAVERAQGPMVAVYEDTANSIRQSFRDTFRDIFDTGVRGFEGMAERIKNVFKDLLADLLTLAIARPVIVPIVGAVGSALGVPDAAQAGVLDQFGVGDLASGAGRLFGVDGVTSAIDKIGAGLGFATPGGAITGAEAAAAGGALSNTALSSSSGFFGSSATLSGTLGAAGLGALGGGLVARLFGGNQTTGSIGGGLGAGIGFAVGGPIGGIIGGLGGGALGGLLGGGQSPPDRTQHGSLNLHRAQITGAGGFSGDKFSAENAQLRDLALGQAQQLTALLSDITGRRIRGSLGVSFGDKSGFQFGFEGARTNVGQDVGALMRGITREIVDRFGELPQHITELLDQVDFSNVEQAIQQLAALRAQIQATALRFTAIADSLAAASTALQLNPALSALSPLDQLKVARREFRSTREAAFGGEEDALSALPGVVNQFLTASRAVHASSPAFAQDFNRAIRALDKSEDVARNQAKLLTSSERVAAAVNRNTAATTAGTTEVVERLAKLQGSFDRFAGAAARFESLDGGRAVGVGGR